MCEHSQSGQATCTTERTGLCLKIKSLKMVTQDTNQVWFSLTQVVLRVTHKSELPRMMTDLNATS